MSKARVAGPLLTAMAAATRWLEETGVDAAVIGGIAASLLGRPRVTKDIDLVVLAEESTWPELVLSGKPHGIVTRVDDALEFARSTRVLLLVHEPSGVELDVSFASLPFERELIERATVRSVRGVSFRVATAEDLLIRVRPARGPCLCSSKVASADAAAYAVRHRPSLSYTSHTVPEAADQIAH